MRELAVANPRRGRRYVMDLLRKERWSVGARLMRRLWRQEGLLVPQKRVKRRRIGAGENGIVRRRATRKNEVWGMDFVQDRTADGRPFRMLVVLDEYTRECLAIECLREAIHFTKGRYEIEVAAGTKLRHDHGSQFISHAFQDELKTLGIESSPSFVRQPEGNGCVERFIRTLKEQLLWLHRFRTVEELNQALRGFAKRFNNHWIIGRIGYRTPAAHRRILLGEAA